MIFLGGLVGCAQRNTGLKPYVTGQLAAEKGNIALAIHELTLAIKRNPQMVVAYEARGDLYKKQGRYHLAAADYQRATSLNPFSFHAFFELGQVYQQLRRYIAAIAAYQHALQINPKDARTSLNLAVAYTQAGHPFRGILYANRAVQNGSNSFATWANIGTIYSQAAKHDAAYRRRAIHYFKQSLEMKPHQPQVYLNLASIYIDEHRFDQASRVFRTAAKLAGSSLISERLGYCYYRLGKLPQAVAAYRQSLKYQSDYVPAINGMGVVYMTISLQHQRHWRKARTTAISYWNRSLKIDPQQPLIQHLVKKFAPAH
jgi:tetratricopeptide (TPR) repeat protein